ncbi:MAG TPA: DUF309 domain-containing protein [Chromatiales bacterium]|nr:DUF309 domain-containing protein [Chromatiales bacterium]
MPAYRYVPGLQPHPTRDRRGHSYGREDDFADQRGWRPDDWPRLAPWLWGVDLFNRFYFWEAHEAWEALWSTTERDAPPGLLLQGLIQIAAALLKVHLGSVAGAARLSSTAIEKLNLVATRHPTLMGLSVAATVDEMRTYFSPLASEVLPRLDGRVPILRLAAERAPAEAR